MKKKINFWCPNCKKTLVYISDKEVMPTNMMCTECFGQVWRKEVEEVKDGQ